MKKDRLKPHVFKVEGPVNFALYNMLTGAFYHFSTEGSVEELRKTLFEEGLIFETEGVIPSKIMKPDMAKLKDTIFLRELQIRLNGKGEDNCWNRIKQKANRKYMQYSTLNRLQEMCQYIPIQKIHLEAEEYEDNKIDMILEEFNIENIELYVENGIDPKQMEYLKNKYSNKGIVFIKDGRRNIKDQKVELFNFLYSQYFNPCLGHQVAVDTNGDIKCCLWFDKILGNIESDDIKEMIIRGDFDKYWEANKNEIEICKDCELRFVCNDCRADVIKRGGDFFAKPSFCDYDPYKGI